MLSVPAWYYLFLFAGVCSYRSSSDAMLMQHVVTVAINESSLKQNEKTLCVYSLPWPTGRERTPANAHLPKGFGGPAVKNNYLSYWIKLGAPRSYSVRPGAGPGLDES